MPSPRHRGHPVALASGPPQSPLNQAAPPTRRPSRSQGLRRLILRMAADNPTWSIAASTANSYGLLPGLVLAPRSGRRSPDAQTPLGVPTGPARCPLGGNQRASCSARLPAWRRENAAKISLTPWKIAHTPTSVGAVASARTVAEASPAASDQTAAASSPNATATRTPMGAATASSSCPLRTFCMNACPLIITVALPSCLSPRIGRGRAFRRPWSTSMWWLRPDQGDARPLGGARRARSGRSRPCR